MLYPEDCPVCTWLKEALLHSFGAYSKKYIFLPFSHVWKQSTFLGLWTLLAIASFQPLLWSSHNLLWLRFSWFLFSSWGIVDTVILALRIVHELLLLEIFSCSYSLNYISFNLKDSRTGNFYLFVTHLSFILKEQFEALIILDFYWFFFLEKSEYIHPQPPDLQTLCLEILPIIIWGSLHVILFCSFPNSLSLDFNNLIIMCSLSVF